MMPLERLERALIVAAAVATEYPDLLPVYARLEAEVAAARDAQAAQGRAASLAADYAKRHKFACKAPRIGA